MQILINFGFPVLMVIMGGTAGAKYGQQFLGSIIGFVFAVIYLSFVMRGDMLMMKGSKAIRRGNIKEGVAFYQKAINTGRLNPDYLVYAPYALLRYGFEAECKDAIEKAEAKRTLTPTQRKTLMTTKALYLWKTGEADESEKLFKEIHEKSPDSQTYSHVGFILLENKKYDEAYEFNKSAMEYNDEDESIMDNMALCHYRRGEYKEALSIYEKIMEKGTRFPVIYYNYALSLIASGDKEKAKEQLKEALEFKFSHIAAISKEDVEKKLSELED